MKYLVLGARGMAGHLLAYYLKEMGEKVTAFARAPLDGVKTIIGDAHNIERITQIIADEEIDTVINCIGILNKAVDNNLSEGIYVNAYFPHLLAKACKEKNAKLIHISTDCVFSGNAERYDEKSTADADSYYGRTKYLGEVTYGRNLTLRTSIVGPELKPNGIGLFHWFMNQEKEVSGYSKVFWTGVTTLELAKVIHKVSKTNCCGLYHLTNNVPISKHNLLGLFNKYFRNHEVKITAMNEPVCSKVLISVKDDFLYIVPSYEQMLNDLKLWMRSHKELYRCYKGIC
ncbi:MAG: SDR family oxidoreductase [Selenomonadaceae bacterium]|nr:SDR family oxidoreductase [Selenomonadaceae bacterium]